MPLTDRRGASGSALVVPGMSGVRALAALSILIYHVWLYGSPGGPLDLPEPLHSLAVYSRGGTGVFLVLSGFLLYLPFARAIVHREPLPSARPFLERRMRRLLPAYWVILLIVALPLGAALLRVDGELVVGSMIDRPDLLLVDLLLLQNFRPETFLTGIGPAWFVSSVATFYLGLPILSAVAARVAGRASSPVGRLRAAMLPAAGLIVLGIGVKAVVLTTLVPSGWTPGWDADWPSVIVRSLAGQADRLGYGMAAAVVWLAIGSGVVRLPPRWWIVPVAGGLLSGGGAVLLHRALAIDDLALESATTLAAACAILVVAVPDQLPARAAAMLTRLLGARLLAAIGAMSYSVYLWNEPVIRWMSLQGWAFGGASGVLGNVVLMGATILALSTATYHLIERTTAVHSGGAQQPRPVGQPPW